MQMLTQIDQADKLFKVFAYASFFTGIVCSIIFVSETLYSFYAQKPFNADSLWMVSFIIATGVSGLSSTICYLKVRLSKYE